MSIDTHIKFDGVDGESTHQDHKGEIQLLSWAWGVSNESSAATGGGRGKGRAQAGDFHFTHEYDKASPVLAKQCAQGKHFPKVVLTSRKSGEGQKDFFKVTMKEVFITSAQNSGNSNGEIMESISMSYADIEFSYKAQDAKGGLGGEVKFTWDIKSTKIA